MSYWDRQRVMKYNPYHDGEGKFASADASSLSHAAHGVVDKAKEAEPAVSASLKAAIPKYAKLIGFTHRLKGIASTSDKLNKEMIEEGSSLPDAVAKMRDALRYTVDLPEGRYVEGVKATLDAMKKEGFTLSSFRNTWGSPIYQGINTNLMTKEGQVLEVQFHTEDSFDAKMLNHKEYEVSRKPGVSAKALERANANMADRQSQLKVPQGAVGFKYG